MDELDRQYKRKLYKKYKYEKNLRIQNNVMLFMIMQNDPQCQQLLLQRKSTPYDIDGFFNAKSQLAEVVKKLDVTLYDQYIEKMSQLKNTQDLSTKINGDANHSNKSHINTDIIESQDNHDDNNEDDTISEEESKANQESLTKQFQKTELIKSEFRINNKRKLEKEIENIYFEGEIIQKKIKQNDIIKQMEDFLPIEQQNGNYGIQKQNKCDNLIEVENQENKIIAIIEDKNKLDNINQIIEENRTEKIVHEEQKSINDQKDKFNMAEELNQDAENELIQVNTQKDQDENNSQQQCQLEENNIKSVESKQQLQEDKNLIQSEQQSQDDTLADIQIQEIQDLVVTVENLQEEKQEVAEQKQRIVQAVENNLEMIDSSDDKKNTVQQTELRNEGSSKFDITDNSLSINQQDQIDLIKEKQSEDQQQSTNSIEQVTQGEVITSQPVIIDQQDINLETKTVEQQQEEEQQQEQEQQKENEIEEEEESNQDQLYVEGLQIIEQRIQQEHVIVDSKQKLDQPEIINANIIEESCCTDSIRKEQEEENKVSNEESTIIDQLQQQQQQQRHQQEQKIDSKEMQDDQSIQEQANQLILIEDKPKDLIKQVESNQNEKIQAQSSNNSHISMEIEDMQSQNQIEQPKLQNNQQNEIMVIEDNNQLHQNSTNQIEGQIEVGHEQEDKQKEQILVPSTQIVSKQQQQYNPKQMEEIIILEDQQQIQENQQNTLEEIKEVANKLSQQIAEKDASTLQLENKQSNVISQQNGEETNHKANNLKEVGDNDNANEYDFEINGQEIINLYSIDFFYRNQKFLQLLEEKKKEEQRLQQEQLTHQIHSIQKQKEQQANPNPKSLQAKQERKLKEEKIKNGIETRCTEFNNLSDFVPQQLIPQHSQQSQQIMMEHNNKLVSNHPQNHHFLAPETVKHSQQKLNSIPPPYPQEIMMQMGIANGQKFLSNINPLQLYPQQQNYQNKDQIKYIQGVGAPQKNEGINKKKANQLQQKEQQQQLSKGAQKMVPQQQNEGKQIRQSQNTNKLNQEKKIKPFPSNQNQNQQKINEGNSVSNFPTTTQIQILNQGSNNQVKGNNKKISNLNGGNQLIIDLESSDDEEKNNKITQQNQLGSGKNQQSNQGSASKKIDNNDNSSEGVEILDAIEIIKEGPPRNKKTETKLQRENNKNIYTLEDDSSDIQNKSNHLQHNSKEQQQNLSPQKKQNTNASNSRKQTEDEESITSSKHKSHPQQGMYMMPGGGIPPPPSYEALQSSIYQQQQELYQQNQGRNPNPINPHFPNLNNFQLPPQFSPYPSAHHPLSHGVAQSGQPMHYPMHPSMSSAYPHPQGYPFNRMYNGIPSQFPMVPHYGQGSQQMEDPYQIPQYSKDDKVDQDYYHIIRDQAKNDPQNKDRFNNSSVQESASSSESLQIQNQPPNKNNQTKGISQQLNQQMMSQPSAAGYQYPLGYHGIHGIHPGVLQGQAQGQSSHLPGYNALPFGYHGQDMGAYINSSGYPYPHSQYQLPATAYGQQYGNQVQQPGAEKEGKPSQGGRRDQK